jgi:hypothetical protein
MFHKLLCWLGYHSLYADLDWTGKIPRYLGLKCEYCEKSFKDIKNV